MKRPADRLLRACEQLVELAEEGGSRSVPRGEYIAYKLRLSDALKAARAAIAESKGSNKEQPK